ncbi:TrmH family RNA methyltransferase [Reichenbachiella agariperforans]|uniref:RNA methyltransferase, TrmH family n=1 Tax=Reichenbachiella agariperforans TaxID=156994 RepID=A0A1M6M4B1_REIAG|nr:RNA methyltransferase [Reichenbachiella agariperforans]MBU2914515.1 RNA methyltransferase [Reichenbachiella agariperforans]SHJ78334.1 RNA methyltransferase, TrmH family [Reichenbachiella agariperforans]
MISNKESKFIKSLQLKKFRKLENRFIVEGAKNVLELIRSELRVDRCFVTETFMGNYREEVAAAAVACTVVSEKELSKVGVFTNNNAALAIAEIPQEQALDYSRSMLGFDRVKDPGNLGTIIRIADWYGFDTIVCSPDSVDCYNPKVVSATMGSFARVRVVYADLPEVVGQMETCYGATLNGDDIHRVSFKEPALILFGNESTGIAPALIAQLDQEVKIPAYGGAESLNVGVSTAVFCDNFRRVLNKK